MSSLWNMKLTIRTFLGRLFHRGISKSDLWNVDVFLASKIARAVKRFAETERLGIPSVILDDPEHDDVDFYWPIWDAILWKIVDGFERIGTDAYYDDWDNVYEQEAVDLFAEFYFSLWD